MAIGMQISSGDEGGGSFGGGPPSDYSALGKGLGTLSGMLNSKKKDPVQVDTDANAFQRRYSELSGNSNLEQLRQSIDSLKYIQDEQARQQLAQPLYQAYYLEQSKQGGQN